MLFHCPSDEIQGPYEQLRLKPPQLLWSYNRRNCLLVVHHFNVLDTARTETGFGKRIGFPISSTCFHIKNPRMVLHYQYNISRHLNLIRILLAYTREGFWTWGTTDYLVPLLVVPYTRTREHSGIYWNVEVHYLKNIAFLRCYSTQFQKWYFQVQIPETSYLFLMSERN